MLKYNQLGAISAVARMNMESISKFFELNGQALINSILLSEDSSGSGFTVGLVGFS